MNHDTWPYNLWEDVLEDAVELVSFQSFLSKSQNDSSPVLYWSNMDDVLAQALNKREHQIVRMRYEQGMTYKVIADEIGVKQERIRQLLVRARRKLREPEYFSRLLAVPVQKLFICQSENRKLSSQNEQLIRQIDLLSEEIETARVKKRLQMPMDSPVDSLNISMRSKNRLVASGINTVGDLIGCTESRLRRIPHLGKVCLAEIKDALAQYSYKLKPDE